MNPLAKAAATRPLPIKPIELTNFCILVPYSNVTLTFRHMVQAWFVSYIYKQWPSATMGHVLHMPHGRRLEKIRKSLI